MSAHATAPVDHLRQSDFRRLAAFIQDYSGIKMPPSKLTMLEGRLRHRARDTGAGTLAGYCHMMFEEGGLSNEAVHLIDAVTTNKTDFFREPEHFRILVQQALPTLLKDRHAGAQAAVKLWSAACSTGAETYTLAMVLADWREHGPNASTSPLPSGEGDRGRGWGRGQGVHGRPRPLSPSPKGRGEVRLAQTTGGLRIDILGTDLSTEVLAAARRAIYPEATVAPVPPEFRHRFLLRSRDQTRRLVRVVPELRTMVKFGRLNLMDADYPVERDFDVIFCRNVLIYFDKPTQHAVLQRLSQHLRPGGFLFLGHSESLAGMDLPLRPVANTVLRKPL